MSGTVIARAAARAVYSGCYPKRFDLRTALVSAIGLGLVLTVANVSAQSGIDPGDSGGTSSQTGISPSDEYRKRIEAAQSIAPMDHGLFGENVSLYNGATEFVVTDIDVPGNDALPVKLSRRHSVELQPQGTHTYDIRLGGLGNWDIDVPHMAATYAQANGWPDQRCSLGSVPPINQGPFDRTEVWQGISIHVPGRGNTSALGIQTQTPKPSSGQYRLATKERDVIDCIAMKSGLSGEGFRMTTTSGIKYYFDVGVTRTAAPLQRSIPDSNGSPQVWLRYRDRYYLLASKIEDRFGNTVQFQYNASGYPTRIWSSDGREILLTYSGGRLVSATSHGRTWQYQYNSNAGQYQLQTVTRPDASVWGYTYSSNLKPYASGYDGLPPLPYCQSASPLSEEAYTLTATHPGGASGTFTFSNRRHYRSGVHATECALNSYSHPENPSFLLLVPNYFDVMGLDSKSISGPGISQVMSWSYDYGSTFESLWGSRTEPASYPCTACTATKAVTVTNPDASKQRYTFGMRYRDNDGRQLAVETLTTNDTVLRSESTQYMADSAVPQQPFHGLYGTVLGGSADPASAYVRPVVATSIVQDGVTFNRTHNTFDLYARPLSVTRSNTQGYSRTDVSAYYDETALWVLGQVKKTTCTASTPADSACDGGTDSVESQTDYGWKAMPWKTYSFGKLQQTLAYHTTVSPGTISSITDGRGNTTLLAGWKRGIPQSIIYADQTVQSAIVEDDATIASVTDENGYKTCYAYDTMGRLKKVTYPSESSAGVCDTSTWSPITQSFSPVAASEYGIPAGHWRQDVVNGNARKKTYFDALWRPLLVREYDAGNVTATQRFTRFAYDHEGRTTFASYPSTASSPVTGTHTTYDVLGRTRVVEQDSELGARLRTTTNYLTNTSGHYSLITDPKDNQTRTWYQAFDQPNYEAPVEIRHPEGAVTHISRDVFGKPTKIRRSNSIDPDGGSMAIDRTYTYNSRQELCRINEPETGETFMGYDAAGNLAWSASGYRSVAAACVNADAVAARRADRNYDQRNRIISLSFPDGRGDTTHTYWPDGLPHTVTANNGDGNVITTSYGYNRRRLPVRERMQWNNIDWSISSYYNSSGHLSSQTVPGSLEIDYAPNALGQPTKAGPYASNASYYPNGAIKQFTYANGIVHTLSQNARGLPETSTDAYGATKFLADSYDYDANGNVAAITDGATGTNQRGNRDMVYDGLDRLTGTTSPMFGTATYAYDVLDNLTRVKLSGGTAIRDHHYCYDSSWHLTNIKAGSCSGSTVIGLGYDPQGNLSNKSGTTFEYDYGNRLRTSSAGNTSYVYDGFGRRVRDYTGGSKYSLYSQSGQLVYANDLRKRRQHWYIYLGGSLVAERERNPDDGSVRNLYQHTDALGSPAVVTDASRVVVERSEYEPYGKVLNRPLKDGPGYTGHVEDTATGLIYAQQRYYDDDIGRFLSVDPVTPYDDPVGQFNRYRYGNNNPYRYTDPDGRLDWEMLADSFKGEVAFTLGLQAKVKVGPAKLSAGLGEASYGAGATLVDVYGFAETSGPSLAIEAGKVGVGYRGSVERSEIGRGNMPYRELQSEGGWMFGFKDMQADVDLDNSSEIGASVSAFVVRASVGVDIGKATEAIFSESKASNGSNFSGPSVVEVSGRIDSARLEKEDGR
ncbi:RHS repeat domain-containing protein [Marilutibacter maris]|nr:RHS repeat-associated core domain-containing protein [Lysobacter maris]